MAPNGLGGIPQLAHQRFLARRQGWKAVFGGQVEVDLRVPTLMVAQAADRSPQEDRDLDSLVGSAGRWFQFRGEVGAQLRAEVQNDRRASQRLPLAQPQQLPADVI